MSAPTRYVATVHYADHLALLNSMIAAGNPHAVRVKNAWKLARSMYRADIELSLEAFERELSWRHIEEPLRFAETAEFAAIERARTEEDTD